MSLYIARTNQKLYFARLHLDQLKAAQSSTSWSKHALIESFNESILFHLASAYSVFLREIAEVYALDPRGVDSLDQLEAKLLDKGVETPEVGELRQLEAGDTWLSQMLAAYAACWVAEDQHSAQTQGHHSRSEIHVVQVNPDHAEDGEIARQLADWMDQLRGLLDRLRESMKEW